MKLSKKGKQNAKNNRELKQIFIKLGVDWCELCGTRFGLTWAHSRKRRFIENDEMMKEVALLCLKCHTQAEMLPDYEMFSLITKIIAERGTIEPQSEFYRLGR